MKVLLNNIHKATMLWYDRDADHAAAAVSYYALFALAPLLFLSITVADWLYPRSLIVELLMGWGNAMGDDVTSLLEIATANMVSLAGTFSVPIVGAVFFSGMVVVWCNTITSGMHHLWGIGHQGFKGWLRKCWNAVRFIAVFELYLISLIAFAVVVDWLQTDLWLWRTFLNSAFFLIATTALFTLAYRILPWERPTFEARLTGAFIASLLLMCVKVLVSLYLSITPFPGLFGAAGIVVVLLMWVYFSACVFYFGAAYAYIKDTSLR